MKLRVRAPFLSLAVALAAVASGCASSSAPAPPPIPERTATTTTTPTTVVSPDTTVVWAIGDSLMVGATERLVEEWPTILVDAEVGRTFETGIDVLEHLAGSGSPDVVVFALGTNNGANEEQVVRVMRLAADADRVIFVNVAVPRPWEEGTNTALAETVARYPNAVLVDWKTISATGSGWFRSDGYHLTAAGIDRWVDAIMTAVTG